ncbi:MAG: hypothetical protein HFI75_08655 [Lachnospiraceae bacterium]|nr:hypothetical protein [Lachnospiraceae bacterium]
MSTHKPAFKEWLIALANTNTEFSDLAYDVQSDNNFPDCSKKEILTDYIKSRTFDYRIHDMYLKAIDLYLDEL